MIKRRSTLLLISILVLFATGWVSIFLQRKQHLIGYGINRTFIFLLINAHLIISIIFLYLIIRHSIKLVIERRNKVPGSAFKRNLFFSFIIFSVIPVVFVFFIAGKLISTSIDNWFRSRIEVGLANSLLLHEQQTKKERDAIAAIGKQFVESFKNREIPKKEGYSFYVWKCVASDKYAVVNGSVGDEVKVWRDYRRLNDRSTKSLRIDFFNRLGNLPEEGRAFDFYGSLYWAKTFGDYKFILAYRYPENIRYPLIEVQNSIVDYSQLRSIRGPIYWNYFFTFLLITLLVLFLSIWCAFFLARGISKPIKELLLAIDKVRKGDLDFSVESSPPDDLAHLVNGFNEMILSLKHAYQHLEFQNIEMLTMLEHIKESVFFVNNYGRIISFNAAAGKLLEEYLSISKFKNKKVNFLGKYPCELFFSLIRELRKSDKSYLSKEITFVHDGEPKIFFIYLTIIQNAVLRENKGVLVVIEDLSEVYKINKMKTWQEAAKQMAHEVKNPLTPIQLATQRLQRRLRKYGDQDPAMMECTDTILEQVKTIKSLVTHFSEFAQMPQTVIESIDVNKAIKEIVGLYEVSYPDISFVSDLQSLLPLLSADKKKLNRVMVNLLDNSVRALQKVEAPAITIRTRFKTNRNQIEILFSDNGPGISKNVRERLFLPYVSTENKNMGLGLAIIHDIMSKSGGSVKLLPSAQGATFQLLLPL